VSVVLLQRSSSRVRGYIRLQRIASSSVTLVLEGEGHWWWSNSRGRDERFGARTVHHMAGSGEGENGGVPAGGQVAMAPGVVTGGVEDAYGEDRATEDQTVTPWAVCIARYAGFILLLRYPLILL
jgi:malate dehydrogenase (oxaloacetate-decarboxylating)(NADP+)